jgi:hypothetical protein
MNMQKNRKLGSFRGVEPNLLVACLEVLVGCFDLCLDEKRWVMFDEKSCFKD